MALYGHVRVSATVFCVHQPACVGCPLSHLSQDSQLDFKQQKVQTALLRAHPHNQTAVNPIHAPARTDGYRLRAKLVHERGTLGLFAEGHSVTDTSACRVLEPRLRQVLNQLRALLPLTVELRAVDARLADEGVLLTLVVDQHPNLEALQNAAERIMRHIALVRGVAYSERHPKSVQVLGGVPIPLLGAKDLIHHLASEEPYHLAVPGGFVQSHADQAIALHAAIERELKTRLGSLTRLGIVELYAGAGALALRLAARGARMTAVEAYAPSVALLERTAREQGLELRALATNAEAALPELGQADVIIVDPPRRGLSVEVRTSIARARPRLLVYVSCEPRTLARDLEHLAWLGLRAVSIQPFDMMPHSDAVETLVIAAPAAPLLPEVLYRDDELVAVNKPPHLPTTPHDEYPTSLLQLVRTLDGCQAAVPVHRLDVGTSGVCLFAVKAEHAAALAKALSDGQKTYTALARGVVHKKGTIRHGLLEGRTPRSAVTHYRRIGVLGTHSLLDVHPQHGRKHQIRRHFAKIGHPLIGDTKYGSSSGGRFFFDRHGLDRPYLHCARIELTHAGKALDLRAPLAADLALVAEQLNPAR